MKSKVPPILLAEDNSLDIELAQEAFKQIELENRLDIVRDGKEVLDYLNYEGAYQNRKKELPIFILLDNKMPKMSGIETLEEIKNNDKFKHIPVIMMTSSRLHADVIKSYDLGVNAYIVKPVDFDEFTQVIKDVGMFWAVWNRLPTQNEFD
jgi:CheY-like chemotaxis protein